LVLLLAARKDKNREVKEKTFTVNNPYGLHARSASLIVQTIQSYKSDVWITVDGQSSPVVNGRSIMDILILGATRGTKLKFRVDGKDEEKILSEIETLFLNNFNEGPRG